MPLELRRPKPEELPQLTTLHRETRVAVDLEFTPEYLAPRLDEAAYFRKIWDSVFNQPEANRAFVLWDDARAIGFVRVGAMTDYKALYNCHLPVPPKTGEIHQLYVLPGIMGRGYGLMLLKAAFTDLEEMGFVGLMACTYQKNTRIRDFIRDMGGHHLLDFDLDVNDPSGHLARHTQACSFYYAELPDSLPGAMARFALEISE